MTSIHSPADLDRANIQVAWSFADRMSAEHFEELCRVTVEQWRRDTQAEVRSAASDVSMRGVAV